MFEYNLLPVPALSKKAKGRKTTPERLAHALCEVLNEQAKAGWEFSRQEHFSCEEKSGLMGKEKHVTLTYLVFRREVGLDALPLDKKLEKLAERKSETVVRAPSKPAPPPEPFPEPMPSPQSFVDPGLDDGEEPTRIFSPFEVEMPESTDAPALGPAEKNSQI